MDVQSRRQRKVGSIYKRSRRSSIEYESKVINRQNIQPSQQWKRRDSMCSTMTLESNMRPKLRDNEGRGKNLNELKEVINRKIQQSSCYFKDRDNLKNTIKSQMNNYNLQEAVRSKKLEMFEANYNNILANYQRKKKQLNQQLGMVKLAPNPILQTHHKQYPSKNNNNQNTFHKNHPKFKQFYQAIDKQIQYEKQLRNIKILIHNHQKKQNIYSQLALSYGIKEDCIQLVSQQYDPFEEYKQTIQQNSKIILEYVLRKNLCEENWNKNIKDRWKESDMRELFTKINFSRSNEVSLKDFVREINCQTSNNYRLRDLYQIYVRLSPMNADNFVRKLSIKNR